jgi:heavy metal translocating P-type ATPase
MRSDTIRDAAIAAVAVAAIVVHLALRFSGASAFQNVPLFVALAVGGSVLVARLAWKAARGDFGSDQLAGISIVAAVLLGQYLAGTIVVLMLSGGETLEHYAVAHATSVLRALASRVPLIAHRRRDGALEEVPVDAISIGDELSVLPHEVCPVDGEVIAGHGTMDESYLTGEPFTISKGPGSRVLSGAINGGVPLVIRATRVAADSRYAQITRVMHEAEQRRPALRRIGDQLGAWYTPLALLVASAAWWATGDPIRFLSVVVVATPCPLLIAIPVAIIGSISTAARRGVIIRDPAALEQLTRCRTMILDKTGTLTHGRPSLTQEIYADGFCRSTLLPQLAAMERYSRHPLAEAIVNAATAAGYALPDVEWIREEPGTGLAASVKGNRILITSRAHAPDARLLPPPAETGLECIAIVNDRYAAAFRFHDVERADSSAFIGHLRPKHGIDRVLIVSGDRESEVRRLAEAVSIHEIHAEASPEQKVAIVRDETSRARTVFLGDGINDAPALLSATVGIAFGRQSDVTSEAARIVIVDSSLSKVDEVMHISYRLRRIALQSALGGMALSVVGMGFAAAGLLPPVAGAVAQEGIDVAVVLNALRTAQRGGRLTDFTASAQRPSS